MSMLIRMTTVATLFLSVGCTATTPTAEKAATAALVQLNAYEAEVAQKIKAENDYYEDVMNAASQRVVDLWENEQASKFEQDAKQFASDNRNTSAQTIGPKLVNFMESSMKAWSSRDEGYETLLAESQQTLRDNRNRLELERGKIRTLRGTLQNLSEARSDREMLLLAVAFAREVKKKYDEIKESSAAASSAANADNSQ